MMRQARGMTLMLGLISFSPSSQGAQAKQSPPAPDNSRANASAHATSQVTADNQSDRKADVELISKIRRSLVTDKSLSTYAHNIKILAEGGQVRLKGPVRSAHEKQMVEDLAKRFAGQRHVNSELTIVPAH